MKIPHRDSMNGVSLNFCAKKGHFFTPFWQSKTCKIKTKTAKIQQKTPQNGRFNTKNTDFNKQKGGKFFNLPPILTSKKGVNFSTFFGGSPGGPPWGASIFAHNETTVAGL